MLRKPEHGTVCEEVLLSPRVCCSNYIVFFFTLLLFSSETHKIRGKQLIMEKEVQRCKPTRNSKDVNLPFLQLKYIKHCLGNYRFCQKSGNGELCTELNMQQAVLLFWKMFLLTLLANKFLNSLLPLRSPPLRKANFENNIIRDK